MPDDTILVGAVAYDPKAVTIWEGIREHFADQKVAMDFVLYSNYERQVESLLARHIDVAWNTPLAHALVWRRTRGTSVSLGMRDSDRDFKSRVLVRKASGLQSIRELSGRTLAVGSRDSTQARILPLHFLKKEGVDLGRVKILAFDTDVGKHGDTGTSELEVLRALHDGRADAGTVGDLIWVTEQAAGRVDPTKVGTLWTTPAFDHCMFDAPPGADRGKCERFTRALMSMSWENPRHRRVLELEGLKQWMPPREEGYASLLEALDGAELR
ncbi:MAG TPA: PhnD/SsuA/transferrin family substrate-binding protein [Planctomycetota bacterium]|nr:PhnD/SsuA/transferrin family substrate-binding protein [Planctomycetota bacterium]